MILSSPWKSASVTIDDSLWPSQKAVILAVGLFMSWDVVSFKIWGSLFFLCYLND